VLMCQKPAYSVCKVKWGNKKKENKK